MSFVASPTLIFIFFFETKITKPITTEAEKLREPKSVKILFTGLSLLSANTIAVMRSGTPLAKAIRVIAAIFSGIFANKTIF